MIISRRDFLVAGGVAVAAATSAAHAQQPESNKTMNAISEIRQIDYTVIFTRDMAAMLAFYQHVMEFPVARRLGDGWIEFRVGSNILALTKRGGMFDDTSPPKGTLSLQLAFRVPPGVVKNCAEELTGKGVTIEHDVADQPWGHRTLFFRDPDGNVIEIYAEI